MIPPRFSDVGKAASDCLAKDFDVGRLSVTASALSQSNVELKTHGTVDNKTNSASGDLELTFRVPWLGTSLATRWMTANVVAANVKIEDAVAENLSLEFDGKFMHTSGDLSAVVKADYAIPNLCMSTIANFGKSPSMVASMVASRDHFVFGCEGTYQVERSKIDAGSVLAGYSGHDLTAVARMDTEGRVRCVVHHCISPRLELAADIGFTPKGTASTFQVGGVHRTEDTTAKVKVDQNGSVSLAYTRPIKPCLTVTFSALAEGSNLSTDVTRMGLALDIDVM
eukprot:comp5775_c0_seq1/m.1640 comp5775_c0_seq1/g.1640  ORF comp5775_c0_seq1/g.1640 comp5775_c0_seq1/m.1640 type:complete len:282 (-) comp5775_c0_seq1:419-1264(-)